MNSQVLKLLIDNKSKAVFGVRLKKGDSVYTVLARKEVILSAGTLNSAQLLMLSGQYTIAMLLFVSFLKTGQFINYKIRSKGQVPINEAHSETSYNELLDLITDPYCH